MKKENNFVEQTVEFVKKEFAHGEGAHDWWHIYRVWQNALKLASKEKADLEIVQLAALLHDLDDWKLGGDGTPVKARKWLEKMGVEKKVLEKVCTATAKKVAEKRHAFMEKYLEEFFLEWDAKDF